MPLDTVYVVLSLRIPVNQSCGVSWKNTTISNLTCRGSIFHVGLPTRCPVTRAMPYPICQCSHGQTHDGCIGIWRIPRHETQHAVRGVDTFRGIHHNNRACHVWKITYPYGACYGSMVPLGWSMNDNIRIYKLFMRNTMGNTVIHAVG